MEYYKGNSSTVCVVLIKGHFFWQKPKDNNIHILSNVNVSFLFF